MKNIKITLPLDSIEVLDGELELVYGGFVSSSDKPSDGIGCGCGCKSGEGCGCDCISGYGCDCGVGCSSGAGCGCGCSHGAGCGCSNKKTNPPTKL